ncbi:endonuclease/exonuclease/phosphatase family protein [Luteolibacter sp. SL250]|uniref:endonuclease/exonuclease/phosphatase family protein n=1 Tax=Luteolibacter sp. SL250 TaxID=2995170 RepID=UPI00226F991D|nr:endonuclease/exonuclease/phosphatase family protein [Luteolibacter sp. SL250]WAC19638.1 endonuclease/exonuclease/phosphatase family protein [Luteolibacter sp. SL250]
MTTLDSFLEKAGAALQSAESRKRLSHRIGRYIRNFLRILTVLYAGSLILLPVLATWIGERNITLAFLLYLPRAIILVPLPFLFIGTLPFSWRLALVQLAAGGFFFTYGMGYEWRRSTHQHFDGTHGPPQLTVLTCNYGQNANQSLQPFKNRIKPDILALQETAGRAKRYLADPNYSEFKDGRSIGEHTFLSRYPIISGELVDLGGDIHDHTPAARFVIDFEGREVVVYSVHFLTVRDALTHYRKGSFLYGILGIVPGTSFHRKKASYESMWQDRIRTAEAFKEIIDRETLPTIVLGDFNAPAGGYIQRILSEGLQDTHQSAGSGSGYTFPGTTRNPLSAGGPWMRIDYILANRHWDVTASVTEEKRPGQHRAVAAKVSLAHTPGP